MKKLLLATANQHKVKELESLLSNCGWEILSLKDFPDFTMPDEDGDSFQANAKIKSIAAANFSSLITMADDSGLMVDYLKGAPGIYSARFAGEVKDDKANNEKLLSLLKDAKKEKRGAKFVCAIAISLPTGKTYFAEGECYGEIASSEIGKGGFGYDPLFYLADYGLTMAELTSDEKNKISHRAKALNKALPILEKLI